MIRNGRKPGDVCGEATCIKCNEFSAIDYVITRARSFKMCENIVVKGLNEYSDHRPLVSKWHRLMSARTI